MKRSGSSSHQADISDGSLQPSLQRHRSPSPPFSCVSTKSNNSMVIPPVFSMEPENFDPSLTQDQSRCGLCEEVLRDPVSISCGHRFCRPCISSNWDQSGTPGDYGCPQCGKRCRTELVPHPTTASCPPDSRAEDAVLHHVLLGHKASLKKKVECICEGIVKPGAQTLLNRIYTELYLTEGESEGVNSEHEVWQIETMSRTPTAEDTAINCNNIFKALPGRERPIRSVLTKGIAGMGKTVSVQKFLLDWTEGNANQDVDFMFVLPFRELNLLLDSQYSLDHLLLDFHPELKGVEKREYVSWKVVFIFDGLDESRLPLNFQKNEKLSLVTQTASLDSLLTNLIEGNLLPSALIWITSRPAAAHQIPAQYVSQITEVRGFNDPQKEEYFRKRISDETQADRIISHIKTSRSLYIMCHIPVFCWISATVLQDLLLQDESQEIPRTLTEMFIHFLIIQTNMKNQKYDERSEMDRRRLLESHKDVIIKLSALAYEHLQKGNLLFYEEDLKECGIDLDEASVYSGMCTEIFKEEALFSQKKVYCFVHLSIQEFLAAFFIFYSFMMKNMKVLKLFLRRKGRSEPAALSLTDLLKAAVNEALQSRNGHLDLFVRFLHGISLESNQKLLQGLLSHTESSSESIKRTIQNLKVMQTKNISPDRCINLIHCLIEMKDSSVQDYIQAFLKKDQGERQKEHLSPVHCSALAYMLQISGQVLDVLDLKSYRTSDEGRRRLIPAVRCCRKAVLSGCKLTDSSCEVVASVLQSVNSTLIDLDLSNSDLQESGVKLILSGLKSPHCKLETLRMRFCFLTVQHCEVLASVLSSGSSHLRHLDLSESDLQDSGVETLSTGVGSPHCKLEILGLSGCCISERGCGFLSSALSSNPSYLRELDLSYNHPGEAGVKLLTARLQDPHCKLEKLNVDHDDECWLKSGLQKYACKFTLDPNTANRELLLSEGNRKVTSLKEKQPYPDHPERFDVWLQVLCREGVSGRCYWEVERSGDRVNIGVTYKGISRTGLRSACRLGDNNKSWILICYKNSYSVRHNSISTKIPATPSSSNRVGVYLDWSAGYLTFYSISSDKLTHLHTFHSTFTEPLYPGFGVLRYSSSVTLCEI
ncbi:NLR family CARD domain-containing protein 3-like isoform X6 [Denticeps clupeoides]|uniref:NLR family CARD domain-containing protein 3-like isoform X6 n=1 Tax=Denticeps clupeoides TaxID=299321 RepID=UPI0010A50B86|nr:NLR family CARD domain-containing protein 3-like isoform X6 [Denticeps clupeoides]